MTKQTLLLALAGALLAGPAHAALPTTSLVDGVLTSTGGSPAADGEYDVVFAIYAEASGGSAAWTETAKVKVTGGRFTHALGSVTAIDTAKVLPLSAVWLGLKVGADPELPRQKVHSTLFSLVAGEALKLSCQGCIGSDQLANGGVPAAKIGFNYAGSATKGGAAADVDCSGCVNVADMKFDGDVDLGGNSLKAKNGTFSGDVAAKTVTATEFIGDGSKLTGLKTPAGECKVAGEVVKGINADGSLKCVAALDPTALPKDGLNEISNDLLSNQFEDTIQGQAGVKIPDNTGSDANATLDFPDIGMSQDFELHVEVANTDLSTLALTVLPPDDKKTGWVLCDPCGKKDEKSYKVAFNGANLPKSGDLKKWIGGNPKGLWNLKAIDTSFCLPQAPGNSALCDVTNKQDGSIVKWHIKIKTLSNKKLNNAGDLYVAGKLWGNDNGHGNAGGTLKVGAGLGIGPSSVTCDASALGTLKWSTLGVEMCTKSHKNDNSSFTYVWTRAIGRPVIWSGGCKSHSTGGGWDRYCSSGVDFNTADDYFSTGGDGRFTFKRSGYYRVHTWADGYDSSYRRCAIRKNGSDIAYTHEYDGHNGWQQCSLDQVWPFKEGDYVEAWYQTDNGHYRWHSWNTAGQHSRMQIEYVGPMEQ